MAVEETSDWHPAGYTGPATILVVDDLASNRRLLERLLSAEGYVVLTAEDGEQATDMVAARLPDVVLMDVRMPKRDGFAACGVLKESALTRLIPIVLMTGSAQREDRVRAIEAGADDFLMKPVDASELKARVKSLVRLKRYTADLDSAESVILSLARTIEARDPTTEGHCERLSRYAVVLGQRLGLGEEDLAALHRGGYLHDIGKIAIPDGILSKPGALTPDEYELMKQHPVIGERLCGDLRALSRVRPIVRHHHERLDGSGYPDGLRGGDIPYLAQIITIVDVYDALTSWRPYRHAIAPEDALGELRGEVERGWRDRTLVNEFAMAVRAGELGGRVGDAGATAGPGGPAPHGAERVLVVQSEGAVRYLIRTILRRTGYDVFEASGAEAAEQWLAAHDGQVDLVIMDPPAGYDGGFGADRRATARWPSLKVLYVSEPSRRSARDTPVEGGGLLVEKPFTADVLCRKVREALDGHATHA